MRLEGLLNSYLFEIEAANKSRDRSVLAKIKPVNYVVVTDGAPSMSTSFRFRMGSISRLWFLFLPADEPEHVIVAAAKRLDAGNFPLCQVRDTYDVLHLCLRTI